jgi:hypothetical protein
MDVRDELKDVVKDLPDFVKSKPLTAVECRTFLMMLAYPENLPKKFPTLSMDSFNTACMLALRFGILEPEIMMSDNGEKIQAAITAEIDRRRLEVEDGSSR